MFLFYFIFLFMDKRTDGRIGVSCGDFVVDGWMNVDALVVYVPCSYQTIVIKLVNLYATTHVDLRSGYIHYSSYFELFLIIQ